MGNAENGRKLYSMAIWGFEQISDHQTAASATYFWALEEKRIGSEFAKPRIQDAKNRINRFNVFALDELVKKI